MPKLMPQLARIPHEIVGKLPDGKYRIAHDDSCLGVCNMIYSPQCARWIAYNAMEGIARCNHCHTALELPLPAVRENWFSKRVLLDIKGIEDDLWRFQLKHENCPPPAPTAPTTQPDNPSPA